MKTILTKYYTEWEMLSIIGRWLMIALLIVPIVFGLITCFIGIINHYSMLITIGVALVIGGIYVSLKIYNMHYHETAFIKEKVFWISNTAILDEPEFKQKWLVVAHDDGRRYHVVPRYITENGETFTYGK